MAKKGLLPEGDLEKDFDTRVPVLFPTKSPVSALTGHSDVETPAPMSTGVFSKLSKLIKRKLAPLISAKQTTDDVYSKGYFERHYPDADEQMKGLLHTHALSAWAHSMDDGEDDGDDNGDSGSQITLTINIKK